jgi:hypothetical protein
MADRKAENGAIQFAQESSADVGTVSRLAGAGQIEADIRRLVAEGFYTTKVAAYTVRGRLINAALDVISIFSPSSLFASGEQGAWYDPSDMSTLFQDTAGTTPVTAIEQPVSLMLDKSKGSGAIGSNTVVNGTFDTDTDWTKGTGWSIGLGVATKIAGTAAKLSQAVTLTAGRYYIVTYTITRTAGTLTMQFTGGTTVNGTGRGAAGTYTDILTAVSGNTTLEFSTTSTFAGTVDNVTLREMPAGNHAYTPAAASTARPTLSARYNLVLNSGLAGAATGTPGTAPTSWAFAVSGGTTDSVSVSDGAGGFRITYSAIANRQMIGQTVSIRANEVINISFTVFANTGIVVNQIATLATIPAGATTAYYDGNGVLISNPNTYTPSTNETITLRLTNSTSAGTFTIRLGVGVSANTTGTVTFGKVQARSVNDGVGLPVYQRVTTATDYDTVNFPPYLRFDGSNDYMLTNSIDFTATDKMTVFAGVRKLSDAASGIPVEFSTNGTSAAGGFMIRTSDANYAANIANYTISAKGTSNQSWRAYFPYVAPISNIISAAFNLAGADGVLRQTIKINGTSPINSAGIDTAGAGGSNFGNYPLYIGMRAGTSAPFNGRLYSLITRGVQSTESEITNTEQWVNSKTKAY